MPDASDLSDAKIGYYIACMEMSIDPPEHFMADPDAPQPFNVNATGEALTREMIDKMLGDLWRGPRGFFQDPR